MPHQSSLKGLYLVTDSRLARQAGHSLETVIREAVEAGVALVQLREKNLDTRSFVELAQRLKNLCRQAEVPFLINDRLDVALAVDADGVHVGQEDMPYETARNLLGPEKIVGVSATNLEEVRQEAQRQPDYLGVGPVFSTSTKADIAMPMGLAGLREAAQMTELPIFAIGGIASSNAAEVMATGIQGVAVVSSVCAAESPKGAVHAYNELLSPYL